MCVGPRQPATTDKNWQNLVRHGLSAVEQQCSSGESTLSRQEAEIRTCLFETAVRPVILSGSGTALSSCLQYSARECSCTKLHERSTGAGIGGCCVRPGVLRTLCRI